MRKFVLAAAAAISMIGLSSGALAQSAAPLSVAGQVRAGADMEEANDYRGGYIIPGLVILVIGVLVYVLTKNNDPTSP